MRSDWQRFSQHDKRTGVAVFRHPTASFVEIRNGTATDGVDMSPFVATLNHTDKQCNATLNWRNELFDSNQPVAQDIWEVQMEGKILWLGVVSEVNDYRNSRGKRQLTVVARSRGVSELWRSARYATPVYYAGTNLEAIVEDIARGIGLETSEFEIPTMSTTITRTTMQMAAMTPWEMFLKIGQASKFSPWVTPDGTFKFIPRDPLRQEDQVIESVRVVEIRGSKSRQPLTRYKMKWLDPNLHRIDENSAVLFEVNITAGFFQRKQERMAYWSGDRTQRAEGTYMEVIQSANSGLLEVADEEYVQIDQFSGLITLTTKSWVATLATATLVALVATGLIGDLVILFIGGYTVTVGRVIHAVLEGLLLIIMMSIGTGHYAIHGIPYDYVQVDNFTEAYDKNAALWLNRLEEDSNDFIASETHAQSITVNELLFRYKESKVYGVNIVDDPNIELGDILKLPDGELIYVNEFRRNLTRGSEAVLEIEGFRLA